MYIVFEGIDGCGKTSLTENIYSKLSSMKHCLNKQILRIKEPSFGNEYGVLVNKLKRKEIEIDKNNKLYQEFLFIIMNRPYNIPEKYIKDSLFYAYLFSKDRKYLLVNEILPNKNEIIIQDRNVWSSYTYQLIQMYEELKENYTKEDCKKIIQLLNRDNNMTPDILFFLSIDTETSINRRLEENKNKNLEFDIFEKKSFLEQVNDEYSNLSRYYNYNNLIIIDASKTKEEVEKKVLKHINMFFK